MKKLILPLVFLIVGLGAGGGAAFLTKDIDLAACFAPKDIEEKEITPVAEPEKPTEFIKLNNQFVVPVIHDGRVASMVVLSLSLEAAEGKQEAVFALEPRLRDLLLRELFSHANEGGFDGKFTSTVQMDRLREKLLSAAHEVFGTAIKNVLVTDVARQDN